MTFDIDDKTKIPLFAVVAAMPIIFGGIFWMTIIYDGVVEATRVNIQQDQTLKEESKVLLDIQERVIRIEERLKTKNRE